LATISTFVITLRYDIYSKERQPNCRSRRELGWWAQADSSHLWIQTSRAACNWSFCSCSLSCFRLTSSLQLVLLLPKEIRRC